MNNLLLAACLMNSSAEYAGDAIRCQNQTAFLSRNSYFLITKKYRAGGYLINPDRYVTALGLNTGEYYDVHVSSELYHTTEVNDIIRFTGAKEPDNGFFTLNQEEGVVVLKKYHKDHLYLIRLFGKYTKTIEVFSADEDTYNEYKEGECYTIKSDKQESQTTSTQQPIEDMWYNTPNYYTYDIEQIINSGDLNDNLYVYIDNAEETSLDGFTFSTQKPKDKIFITNFSQTCFLDNEENAEYRYDLLTKGCVVMPIKSFKTYPIQSRIELCNLINSIWALGVWFEIGQYSQILTELKNKTLR